MRIRSVVWTPAPGVFLVGVVLGALALAACGGGGDRKAAQTAQQGAPAQAVASPPSFDYCTLLTREEVEAATGWKVATTKLNAGPEYGTCTYTGRTGATVFPPENVEAGVISCVTNMPCTDPLPDFHNSAEMAQYRKKGYQEYKGPFEGVQANIVALEGFGVPAIDHELAGMRSIEMQLGHRRVAYVSIWGEAGPARDLAKKVLARAH